MFGWQMNVQHNMAVFVTTDTSNNVRWSI